MGNMITELYRTWWIANEAAHENPTAANIAAAAAALEAYQRAEAMLPEMGF